jgi:hypothetical protein
MSYRLPQWLEQLFIGSKKRGLDKEAGVAYGTGRLAAYYTTFLDQMQCNMVHDRK